MLRQKVHGDNPVQLIFMMINSLFIMRIEVYYIQTRMYVNSFLVNYSKYRIEFERFHLARKTYIKMLKYLLGTN